MNNTNQNTNKTELGALWKKKSKSGMSFLSGYVKVDDLGLEKEIKVVVFANSKKSNEKAPDYRIYISKPLDTKELNVADTHSNEGVKTKSAIKTAVKIQEDTEDVL